MCDHTGHLLESRNSIYKGSSGKENIFLFLSMKPIDMHTKYWQLRRQSETDLIDFPLCLGFPHRDKPTAHCCFCCEGVRGGEQMQNELIGAD